MNPDVLQFQCSACKSVLTVPSHMAGVTGPCPICGQTITSPNAAQTAPAAPASLFNSPSPHLPKAVAPVSSPAPGPVMPMPHSIAQHLSPAGHQTPPAQGGGFLGGGGGHPMPQESSVAPWQQPGLGQTLLGGIPQQQHPASIPPGQGLPPRRAEGMPPQALTPQQPAMAPWGSAPTSPPPPAAQQPSIGSPLFPQRGGGGAPSHSSLIPGSPTLPTLGGHGGSEMPQQSLLSREIPATIPAPPISLPEARKDLPSSLPRQTRQLKKPKRSSNIFMFALAVLFLAGFLAAAGWMFRDPIMEVVNRYMPELMEEKEIASIPAAPPNPSTSPPSPAETSKPETPAPSIAEAPKRAAFDPDQAKPPRAETPTPQELAALQSSSPAQKPEVPAEGLTEVPPKTMTPAVQNNSTAPDAGRVTMPATRELKIEVTEEAKPAAEALMRFLTAKDLKERMRYTLAADAMKPMMELYYQAHPSGPVNVDAVGLVRLDPKPQIGGGAHAVFGVESRTWEYPVPVMLEETKDGFQVDWLSFVEFKDRLLEKFFESYQEGPARFHVGITRTHYFQDKVPNKDNKDAFRVGPAPPNPFLTTVFVEKDSQLGRELKDRIPWGAQVWAIVELEWVKLGTQQWVQLVGVPQLNWYSVPAETKSKPSKSSDIPNEVQRAVPVGR